MSKFKHCGRGVCAAEAGHKGTCAQASGWDEFTADVADRAYESGLADGRAEAVAEEPEWEYGVKFDDLPGRVFDRLPGDPRATHRRRKAGPWVPVKQEGAE